MPARVITYSKKICLLGTFGVGKTSLVRRFVHDLFEDRYLSTIGVQIYQKELTAANGNENLKLIIWDLANIERFTAANKNYFRGSAGAIVVFDLTRPESYDESNIYLSKFQEMNPKAGLVFAGNKIDLIEGTESAPTDLIEISEKYRSPYYLTSAKTAENVSTVFDALGKRLLESS